MELAFSRKFLRDLCEDPRNALETFGPSISSSLRRRLADLRAADSVSNLVVGLVKPPVGARRRSFMISLDDIVQIHLCVNHVKCPMLDSGEVDWSRVNRVMITGVR